MKAYGVDYEACVCLGLFSVHCVRAKRSCLYSALFAQAVRFPAHVNLMFWSPSHERSPPSFPPALWISFRNFAERARPRFSGGVPSLWQACGKVIAYSVRPFSKAIFVPLGRFWSGKGVEVVSRFVACCSAGPRGLNRRRG